MATKKVVDIKPDISTQIETLRSDIAMLTQSIKSEAKATAVSKKSEIDALAHEKAEQVKAKYGELSSNAEDSIRANPLTSVAIAVGAGVLLGMLSRR